MLMVLIYASRLTECIHTTWLVEAITCAQLQLALLDTIFYSKCY